MCVIVLLHANKGALIPRQKLPNLVLAQQALYMLPDMNIYESACICTICRHFWLDKEVSCWEQMVGQTYL